MKITEDAPVERRFTIEANESELEIIKSLVLACAGSEPNKGARSVDISNIYSALAGVLGQGVGKYDLLVYPNRGNTHVEGMSRVGYLELHDRT